MATDARIPVGISACLLGHSVRYDGGHKYADWTELLADQFAWIALCPEDGAGLGTPRPAMTLVGNPGAPRLVSVDGTGDFTDPVVAFASAEVARLASQNVCGFALKSKSPSCGLRNVPAGGAGLFARALRRKLPHLPIADEVELADSARRDRFVARVVARARERGIL